VRVVILGFFCYNSPNGRVGVHFVFLLGPGGWASRFVVEIRVGVGGRPGTPGPVGGPEHSEHSEIGPSLLLVWLEIRRAVEIRMVAQDGISSFLWSGATEKAESKSGSLFFPPFFARKAEKFSAFPPLDHTTPKMTNENAGSAVAAVLAVMPYLVASSEEKVPLFAEQRPGSGRLPYISKVFAFML